MAILMPPTIITTAQANVITPVLDLGGGYLPAFVEAVGKLTYGSGGTSVALWIQTSFDNVNWLDVSNMNYATASLALMFSSGRPAVATNKTAAVETLAANAVQTGFIGRYWRAEWTSVGTYAGNTTLEVDIFGNY